MNGIQPYSRIYAVQRPALPALNLRKNTVYYAGDSLSGDAVTELFFEHIADLTSAFTNGIKTYNPVCQGVCKYLFSLFDDLRVKSSVAVTRGVDGHLTNTSLYFLAHVAIAAIAKLTFAGIPMAVSLLQGSCSIGSPAGAPKRHLYLKEEHLPSVAQLH